MEDRAEYKKQLKIEVGKFYKIRSGEKVRIYATDGGDERPIHGAIFEDNEWIMHGWRDSGIQHVGLESGFDIVSEWEEPTSELKESLTESVNHPNHYGGSDNPYEAIKVIEAWGLDFNLGNAVKYIARADKKGKKREDLQKAVWYLERVIEKLNH